MKLRYLVAVCALAGLPLAVQAQQSGTPKPTNAAAQQVVNMIGAHKAKLKTYCDLGALADQADAAAQKNDTKTAEALADKMDAMAEQLGPEYIALMDALENLDDTSKEGEAIAETLSELDDKCAK